MMTNMYAFFLLVLQIVKACIYSKYFPTYNAIGRLHIGTTWSIRDTVQL